MKFFQSTVIYCFMVILLLAGCSGNNAEPPGNSANPNSGNTPPAANGNGQQPAPNLPAPEPTELSFMFTVGSLTSQEMFMDMFGNKIVEKFPHITPLWVSGFDIEKRLTAGAPMDILGASLAFLPSHILTFQLQHDITELMKKYNYDVTQVDDSLIATVRQMSNGGLYGLPFSADSVNITYNRDIFQQFGLSNPKDNMTWEELYELTRLTSRVVDGVQYYGLGMSFPHLMLMDPLAPIFVNAKTDAPELLSEPMLRAFRTLTDVFAIANNEPPAAPANAWDYGPQRTLFSEQRMAMLLGPSANGARFFKDTNPALNWDMASYPKYSGKLDLSPQFNPSTFFVTDNSKHKEAAFQVIAYMTSVDMQKHLSRQGYWPSIKDDSAKREYGKDLPWMEGKNINAMYGPNAAVMPPLSVYTDLARNELKEAFRQVVRKEKDINSALREAQERSIMKIQQEKAK